MVAALSGPAAAQGRVGELDRSFGKGGRVVAPFKVDGPIQMTVAPDGSTVLYGEGFFVRLRPNGSLDRSFGDRGRLVLPKKLEGLDFGASSISMDGQGRVLVFGTMNTPVIADMPERPYSSWAAVLRLNPDGGLDPSFGEGKGFVRGDFGLRSKSGEPAADIYSGSALSGRIDSHDRPVFVADRGSLVGGCRSFHDSASSLPGAVVRLTEAGSPDQSFGGGDGVTPIEGLGRDPILAIDAADQPLAAFTALHENGCVAGVSVYRFGADGAPLAGFGGGGIALFSVSDFSLLEASGAMLMTEGLPSRKRIFRALPNGAPDASFGVEGWATVRMSEGAGRTLTPAAVDTRGRILLAGSFFLPKPRKGTHGRRGGHRRTRRPTRAYFAVTRLLATGELDTSFGKRGWIFTPMKGFSHGVVSRAALDSQGRLLLAGTAKPPGDRRGRFVLARYLLGG